MDKKFIDGLYELCSEHGYEVEALSKTTQHGTKIDITVKKVYTPTSASVQTF